MICVIFSSNLVVLLYCVPYFSDYPITSDTSRPHAPYVYVMSLPDAISGKNDYLHAYRYKTPLELSKFLA